MSVDNGGSTDYFPNSLNQYDYVDSADYDYDQNGNLTGIDVDDNGTNEYEYVYDCENRLTEAKEDGQTVAEYSYDENRNLLDGDGLGYKLRARPDL